MLATLSAMGWTMMVLSIGSVTILTYWCFAKVLKGPKDEPDLPSGLGA